MAIQLRFLAIGLLSAFSQACSNGDITVTPLGPVGTGSGQQVSTRAGTAYATGGNGLIYKVDLATGIASGITGGVQGHFLALSPDKSKLYISSGEEIRELNTATNGVRTLVNGFSETEGIAVHPDSGLIYVIDDGAFYSLNPVTLQKHLIGSGIRLPYGLAIEPSGTTALVVANESLFGPGGLVRINLTTGVASVVAEIPTDNSPAFGIAVPATHNIAVVTTQFYVALVNLETGESQTLPLLDQFADAKYEAGDTSVLISSTSGLYRLDLEHGTFTRAIQEQLHTEGLAYAPP